MIGLETEFGKTKMQNISRSGITYDQRGKGKKHTGMHRTYNLYEPTYSLYSLQATVVGFYLLPTTNNYSMRQQWAASVLSRK